MITFRKRKTDLEFPETMLHKKLNFAATEAYKLLRTNLLFTLPDENKCRIVGVTSALRGEGKSTTSVNLSYTLAETGKRVLLIDADLRLPTVAKKVEKLNLSPGLSNVLAGIISEKEVIQISEDLPNWHFITAGDIPPNPTEMLASSQTKALISRLSEEYDFIIIDVPPVNVVSDALIVSSMVDGMLVVIRENYSGRRDIQHCMRQLELADAKVLGFVMNSAHEASGGYNKYKKYYKYYGKKKAYGYENSYGDYAYAHPDADVKKSEEQSAPDAKEV